LIVKSHLEELKLLHQKVLEQDKVTQKVEEEL
jgi:hypothetical protein